MAPKASVVTPTYNRRDILARCLRSLLDQTAEPSSYEVVVVDDGSTDDTPDLVAQLAATTPVAVVYVRQANSGRARARNAGVRAAHGELIIFLDSDMVVTREFVAAHIKAHDRPNLVVNGPVINTANHADPTSEPFKITDMSRAFFATGNVSIERAKLLQAGLFDEDFVEYGWEDLELGHRLRDLGLTAVRVPDARSYHFQHQLTYAGIPGLIRKEKERGHMAVLFYRKHPNRRTRMVTLISPVFFGLDRLLTPFHWTERPATLKLLERLDRAGHNRLFRTVAALVRNHAYADGLREALKAEREMIRET